MRLFETFAKFLPIRLLDLLRRHWTLPSCFGLYRECCPPAWNDVPLRQHLPAPVAPPPADRPPPSWVRFYAPTCPALYPATCPQPDLAPRRAVRSAQLFLSIPPVLLRGPLR